MTSRREIVSRGLLECAVVSERRDRYHGLEHVERFSGAALPTMMRSGAHTQRVHDQV